LFESIQNLSNRVEQSERKSTAAVAPLAEQVTQLSAQVEEVKSQKSAVSTAPVERAVMRITERLDNMEESPSRRQKKYQGGWWRKNRD
jgi:DNA repair exonuclease SbcCD ATPase subunit